MKNTNTTEFKNKLRAFLIPKINDRAADYDQPAPEKPFSWLLNIARSEVPHEFRKGNQAGLEYWLSGLGLSSLPFYYSDIVEAAEWMHDCTLTEKERDAVCERWFSFIACKILQLAAKE